MYCEVAHACGAALVSVSATTCSEGIDLYKETQMLQNAKLSLVSLITTLGKLEWLYTLCWAV